MTVQKKGIKDPAFTQRKEPDDPVCICRKDTDSTVCIRRSHAGDLPGLNHLLYQVEDIHRQGRPDLFALHQKKYTDEELLELLKDDSRPVFVAVDRDDRVLGYAFCVLEDHTSDHAMTDFTGLYIDDLCVDEQVRGQRIGKMLYEYVSAYARETGCYHITLHVWDCNPGARKFYEACGFRPLKTCMELIL